MEIIQKMNRNLDQINIKLDKLIKSNGALRKITDEAQTISGALDVMTLLSLPDHLRKSALILCRLGRATASQVSMESRRARAIESNYLNQLVTMGHIKKVRNGRDVEFYLE